MDLVGRQALESVPAFDDLIAGLGADAAEQCPHDRLIVYDQDFPCGRRCLVFNHASMMARGRVERYRERSVFLSACNRYFSTCLEIVKQVDEKAKRNCPRITRMNANYDAA